MAKEERKKEKPKGTSVAIAHQIFQWPGLSVCFMSLDDFVSVCFILMTLVKYS